MLHDDSRFDQLILLNQQVTETSPEEPGYSDLLKRVYDLALELYLEYQDDKLLPLCLNGR